MVDRDLLAAKLAQLADRVARARMHTPATAAGLSTDRDALDMVSFNLMLAVQLCADIAAHLVADEGWPAASSTGEAFARLSERGVIPAPIAAAMVRAAAFRNVIAHAYATVDGAAVFAAATQGVDDLDAFARAVASWAATQRGG